MNVRPAVTPDIPCVMELIRSCIRRMEAQGIDQWDEFYPDLTTITNDIEQRELFALERDGVLVGIIVLNEHQEPEYREIAWHFSGKALVVHRLAVAPEFQGRGCARELMRFTHEYAREQGYANIRLDAFSGNPGAVALYERLGYRMAGSVRFRKGKFYCFEINL